MVDAATAPVSHDTAPANQPGDATADPAGTQPENQSGDAPANEAVPVKPEGDTGEAETKAEDAQGDEAGKGAPEQYEAFTLPEGVELDQELHGAFVEIAKELDLSQEQAQKLVSIQAERELAQAQTAADEREKTINAWADEAEADKEFGGKEFEANVAIANKALKQLASPALIELLTKSGLGNHPEIIRPFFKMGKMMQNDRMLSGGATGDSGDRLAALFPSMQPK